MARKQKKNSKNIKKTGTEKTEVKEKELKHLAKSKQEKQALTVIAFIFVAFVAFFVFFLVYKNAGTFVYNGIKFKKTSSDSLILYHGRISMNTAAGLFNYNLYLRNDPRLLQSIPSNISSLVLRKTGFVSFDPDVSSCYGSNIAAFELASILGALGMQVKGATTSHKVAIDEGIPERDCADAITNKTIVVLQKSDETTIQQRLGDCYVLNISNCNVIPAAEAFILEVVKGLWQINAS